MKEVGTTVRYAGAIGGGTKSSEWLQMLADCIGLEIRVLNSSEGGGMGAIILAMVAEAFLRTFRLPAKHY